MKIKSKLKICLSKNIYATIRSYSVLIFLNWVMTAEKAKKPPKTMGITMSPPAKKLFHIRTFELNVGGAPVITLT